MVVASWGPFMEGLVRIYYIRKPLFLHFLLHLSHKALSIFLSIFLSAPMPIDLEDLYLEASSDDDLSLDVDVLGAYPPEVDEYLLDVDHLATVTGQLERKVSPQLSTPTQATPDLSTSDLSTPVLRPSASLAAPTITLLSTSVEPLLPLPSEGLSINCRPFNPVLLHEVTIREICSFSVEGTWIVVGGMSIFQSI